VPKPKSPPPATADADFSEEEIARRRDEVVRRMLNTPHKPQEKTRVKKVKKKRKQTTKA
jgi:hypothetical protein